MKKVRKGVLLLTILLLIPVVLAGCNSKPKVNADKTAKVLINSVFKGDKTGLSKVGATEKSIEQDKKHAKEDFCESVMLNLGKYGGSDPSDTQMDSMYNAFMNSLKKINVTTSIDWGEGKSEYVLVKTNYIDLKTIEAKAKSDASTDVHHSGIRDITKREDEFTKVYVNSFIKALNDAKPTSDTHKQTFAFVIKGGYWVPERESLFYEDVDSLTYGQ